MPELDYEAVSFRVASQSFAAVRRLGKRDLETPLGTRGAGLPTAGGILLFMAHYFPTPVHALLHFGDATTTLTPGAVAEGKERTNSDVDVIVVGTASFASVKYKQCNINKLY